MKERKPNKNKSNNVCKIFISRSTLEYTTFEVHGTNEAPGSTGEHYFFNRQPQNFFRITNVKIAITRSVSLASHGIPRETFHCVGRPTYVNINYVLRAYVPTLRLTWNGNLTPTLIYLDIMRLAFCRGWKRKKVPCYLIEGRSHIGSFNCVSNGVE